MHCQRKIGHAHPLSSHRTFRNLRPFDLYLYPNCNTIDEGRLRRRDVNKTTNLRQIIRKKPPCPSSPDVTCNFRLGRARVKFYGLGIRYDIIVQKTHSFYKLQVNNNIQSIFVYY